MLRLLLLSGAGLAVLVPSPGWAQSAAAVPGAPMGQPQMAAPASAPLAGGAQPAAAVPAEYRIGRDDTLQIEVFQVPELSQTVQVDANGTFTLPFVGRVAAAGHTASELADTLRAKLADGYLRDPQITVVVKTAVAQRVTINGAVVQPGVYTLLGPNTLLQALALAKGPDPRLANKHQVAIFRNLDGRRQGQVFDLSNIEKGRTPDPMVQADDIIVVETSGVRSFFAYFAGPLAGLTAIHP